MANVSDLSPQTILLTGSSTGIGHAVSESLAEQGHTVYAALRNTSVEFKHPGIKKIRLDVNRAEERAAAIEQIQSETGALDVLVNNAGIAIGGPLELIDEKAMREQFDVNFFALHALTQLALPLLKKSNRGKIINVSSVSGLFSFPFMGPYCASKFALEALSDAWRVELKKFGVKVVLVEPGPVKTPIWNKSINREALYERSGKRVDEYQPGLDKFIKIVEAEAAKGIEVHKVAQLFVDIVSKSHPRARYTINGNRHLLRFLSLLPDSWVDKAIRS